MSSKITRAAVAACLLAAAAFAEDAAKAPAKKTAGRHHTAPKPVFMPAGEMKWQDLAGAPGVKIADLWGNHEKGAYGAIIKFPAGFAAPLHTHTNDARLVVISGTFVQTPEGKEEVRLGPGSYLKQPGDGYRHTTACDQSAECVFFVESNGKFDIKMVPEPKAAEKK